MIMQATNTIGPDNQGGAPTALLAEDEVLIRMSLAERLRDVGFHVLEAANGEEGRRIAGAMGGAIDVVISDVHMASQDEGLEFARWMGQHYPQIPVILTSGDKNVPRSPVLAECRNVTDFVQKPYSEWQMELLARQRLAARDAARQED